MALGGKERLRSWLRKSVGSQDRRGVVRGGWEGLYWRMEARSGRGNKKKGTQRRERQREIVQ